MSLTEDDDGPLRLSISIDTTSHRHDTGDILSAGATISFEIANYHPKFREVLGRLQGPTDIDNAIKILEMLRT